MSVQEKLILLQRMMRLRTEIESLQAKESALHDQYMGAWKALESRESKGKRD